MKFDSGTMIQNPSEEVRIKALEDAGFDGAREGAHDPFCHWFSSHVYTEN